MYRSEEDIALLGELAGVLDQTVTAAGLSAGSYLVLRALAGHDGVVPVRVVADHLGVSGDEVAEVAQRLVADRLVAPGPAGLGITDDGRERLDAVDERANEAMRAYVLERPHTATVYGLVAAMGAGRFTVEDLLAFIAEGPGDAEEDGRS